MTNKKDSFAIGYLVARRLERIWKKSGRYACISCPFGLSFFDTERTTPFEAVSAMKEQYDVSYSTVGNWINNINTSDATYSLN